MATPAQVQQLYLVYFGRPADPEGLRFWTADTTTPIATIGDGFATTPEFNAVIAGKTLTQVVDQFYVRLFNRSGEPAGVAFWVDLLSRGLTTIQQVGLNISSAALVLPATNTDNIAVTSKLTAGGNWTAQVGSTIAGELAYTGQAGVNAGVSFLAPVLTPATIPDAAATTAAVTALINSNSGVGSTASLSTFQDVFSATSAVRLSIPGGNLVESLPFRFTASSETVTAGIGTVQAIDQLIDPTTTDSDNFDITITAGFGNLPDLTTTNIENFRFVLNGADGGGTFDFNNGGNAQTGVKSVVVSGTIATPGGYNILHFADAGATVLDASGVTTPGVNGRITAFAYQAAIPNQVAVSITGGAGNDVLRGGSGADVLTGNAGNDTMFGQDGNDTMIGGSGADIMLGDGGNDSMSGGLDADTMFGGNGDDSLFGNEGNDIMDGGAGNDSLTGGTGADTMTGGGGSNRFLYGSLTQLVADTGITQATSDTITDFATGTDRLQTGLAGSATNFRSIGAFGSYDAARTAAQGLGGFDGAVRYVYATFAVTTAPPSQAGIGVLFVDADSNNSADASILFTPTVPGPLTFADIIA